MSDQLVFEDLNLIEEPVTIAGTKYLLREANGAAACAWRNAQLACTKLGPDGTTIGIGNIADTEPLLVSLCLFVAETGKTVPLPVVRSWPDRVIKRLAERAKEISGLNETDNKESLLKQKESIEKRLAKLEPKPEDGANPTTTGA